MLILFDLDKTLIDASYAYTSDSFGEVVERAIAAGHVIGLNSDTPIAGLRHHHDLNGMNGPIIGEFGAVVWMSSASESASSFGTDVSPDGFFPALRDRIIHRLTRSGQHEVILGDPTSIIRTTRYRLEPPQSVVLASALRLYSLHFAARRISGDVYTIDHELLVQIYRAAQVELSACPAPIPLSWDLNPEYGILILHAAATCKAVGVRSVMSRLGVQEAIMVGDGMFDHVNLPGVEQWAVGNAKPEYKALCKRVATGTFTNGAIELLDSFLANA